MYILALLCTLLISRQGFNACARIYILASSCPMVAPVRPLRVAQPCFAKAWAPSICQAQGDPYQLRPGRKALSSATAHTLHLCC